MKYIHRACLQQWREATTNPANKLRCSECHANFRIIQTEKTVGFVGHLIKKIGRVLLAAIAVEICLLCIGYVFKIMVVIVTFSPRTVDWSPWNFYHHFSGVILIASSLYNMVVVVDPVCDAFRWNLPRRTRRLLVAASLTLNIPFGYVAKFFVWVFTTVPWDWTVSYGSGFLCFVLAATYLYPTVQRVYTRWSEGHRAEQVVGEQGDVEMRQV